MYMYPPPGGRQPGGPGYPMYPSIQYAGMQQPPYYVYPQQQPGRK